MINQNICPFCQQSNGCSGKAVTPCWCFNTEIPLELRQLVPKQLTNTVCICNGCVARFKQNPTQFKQKYMGGIQS